MLFEITGRCSGGTASPGNRASPWLLAQTLKWQAKSSHKAGLYG